MNTASLIDVDKQVMMSLDHEAARETKPDNEEGKIQDAVNEDDDGCLYDEYSRFIYNIGKTSKGGWQQKGAGK